MSVVAQSHSYSANGQRIFLVDSVSIRKIPLNENRKNSRHSGNLGDFSSFQRLSTISVSSHRYLFDLFSSRRRWRHGFHRAHDVPMVSLSETQACFLRSRRVFERFATLYELLPFSETTRHDDDDDDDDVWLRFLYPSNDASCSDARRSKSKEKDNAVMEFLHGRKSTRAKA